MTQQSRPIVQPVESGLWEVRMDQQHLFSFRDKGEGRIQADIRLEGGELLDPERWVDVLEGVEMSNAPEVPEPMHLHYNHRFSLTVRPDHPQDSDGTLESQIFRRTMQYHAKDFAITPFRDTEEVPLYRAFIVRNRCGDEILIRSRQEARRMFRIPFIFGIAPGSLEEGKDCDLGVWVRDSLHYKLPKQKLPNTFLPETIVFLRSWMGTWAFLTDRYGETRWAQSQPRAKGLVYQAIRQGRLSGSRQNGMMQQIQESGVEKILRISWNFPFPVPVGYQGIFYHQLHSIVGLRIEPYVGAIRRHVPKAIHRP